MPSWSVHRRVYGLLGLNVSVCKVVDRIVDVDPPLLKEVVPEGLIVELEDLRSFVGHDFGCGEGSFPLMAKFMYRRFGLSGVRCFIAHCVLDFVEKLYLRGYSRELIILKINAKAEGYLESFRSFFKETGFVMDEAMLVCDKIVENIDAVLNVVSESARFKRMRERELLKRVVMGFGKYIVTPYLKYTIRDSEKRRIIRGKILDEFTCWLKRNQGYLDLNRVVEGLNELEMSISKHGVKTIPQLSKVIVNIAEGNEDFRIVRAALLRILSYYGEETCS